MVVCVMVSSVSCGKCVHDVGGLCCLSKFRVALVVSRVSLVVAGTTLLVCIFQDLQYNLQVTTYVSAPVYKKSLNFCL